MKRLIFLLFLSYPAAFATTPEYIPVETEKKTDEQPDKTLIEKTEETLQETTAEVKSAVIGTRERRESADYFVLLNYSPIDLFIPSKWGATAGFIQNGDTTWELEYLKGSLSVPFIIKDVGSITDERISIIGRSYHGNSFNLSYGLSYYRFSMHLGDEIMSRVSGGSYPSLDIIDLQALGFNAGLGNRWILKHGITIGVDWISWSQPVFPLRKKSAFVDYAENPNDRENVEDAIRLASYFPRLSFFKLQVGILF